MTEKSRTSRTKHKKQEETEKPNEELESITVVYNGKEHTVKFPNNADAKVISQSIKRETGVKGSFYVHFGEKSNNYLHCSSVTRGNLAKLAGLSLEVRGGNGKFDNNFHPKILYGLCNTGVIFIRMSQIISFGEGVLIGKYKIDARCKLAVANIIA